MLQNERHERILARLKKHNTVKVAALAKEMGISESTIRRDITELDHAGKLKKVFGGAVAVNGGITFGETDVSQRTMINVEEKELIAKYAAGTVQELSLIHICSSQPAYTLRK